MAQAELHFLHARLQGGKLNKAKKGELRFPLPVGFCYDEEGRIILDPDEEVRGAVGLVFRLFRETGSAFAVMQRFAEQRVTLSQAVLWGSLGWQDYLGSPDAQPGAWACSRTRPMPGCTSSAVISIAVRSARRARFINGCTRWRCPTGASVCKSTTRGTSLWKSSCNNQERLEKNRTNGEETVLAGPAREGLALLQGLLLCGTLWPRADGTLHAATAAFIPAINATWLRREGLASKDCMSFRCDLLDAAIAEEVLKALQPAELELALAALEELESRDQDHLAPVADADRTRRVRSRARRAALSGGRSLPASGGEHAGAALERCAAAVRGPQKASRGVSAARSPRRHPRAEGESPRSGTGFTAGVACPHHAGQGPQADVAAAHQGYYGREALHSEAASGSPPLAGRGLHRRLACNSRST